MLIVEEAKELVFFILCAPNKDHIAVQPQSHRLDSAIPGVLFYHAQPYRQSEAKIDRLLSLTDL